MAKSNQSDKDWQAALKAVEAFDKKIKDTEKSTQKLNGVFSNIATELFGISGSAFFKETKLSIDEIIEKEKELAKATNDLGAVNKKITDDMRGAFGGLESGLRNISKTMSSDVSKALNSIKFADAKDIAHLSQVNKLLEDENLTAKEKKQLQDLQKAYTKDNLDYQEKNKEFIEDELKKYPDFMKHASEKDRLLAASIIAQGGFNELVERELDLSGKILRLSTKNNGEAAAFTEIQMENQIIAGEMAKSVGAMNEELKKGTKETFSLRAGFVEISKNFVAKILPSMMEYDKVISKAGKNFGFIDTKSIRTSNTMASLGGEAARFNVSMEDAVGMMGALGDELKTIDQNYLANSVKQFMSIEKAIGLSYEETGQLAGEMMRTGKSAEDVKNFLEKSNNLTKNFGVNTKNVMKSVSKNIDKMRQMGFQGGEESLTRMAIKAERLNMQVDEIFDVAKKARTIEGAMEMASELQLAGGSFANIDPMSLLAAARKGPEELQKILTQMGGDIGDFDEKTGELKFDAVDIDRLQMVADATGQSLDSIQKGLMKSASDANKIKMFDGVTDGLEEMDAMMVNSGLADMMKIGENGEVEFNASSDMAERMGIGSLEELQSLSGQQLKEKMEADAKTLQEQADANKSLDDSLNSFKQSLLNILIQFEPVLKLLTDAMNFLVEGFNILPGWGKLFVGGLIGAFMLFGTSVGMFVTQGIGGFLKGSLDFGKSIIGFGKSSLDFLKNIGSPDTWKNAASSIGGVLKNAFTPKAAAAVTDTISTAAKPLATTAGAAAGTVADAAGAKANSEISKKIDMDGLLKFSAAMALIGVGVGAFAYGVSQLPGGMAGLTAIAEGMLIVAGLALAVFGISKLKIGLTNIVEFSIAMAIIGAAMIPFAFAMSLMAGVDWTTIVASVGMMTLLVLGLAVLGSIITPLAPFLFAGAIALIAVGAMLLLASVSLLIAASAFEKLSTINWDGFSGMGTALLSTVPGLLAFSLASMMFLNPIALLGMIAMTATLGGLAMVMIPLGIGMTMAADGMERFASGLEKLQAAANNLDFERLEALKELSIGMATSGVGGGIGDEIQKIADALSALTKSGGGTGGGNRKIEIDLKLNGRQIKEMIIDDTEIVS